MSVLTIGEAKSINPATEEILATHPYSTNDSIDASFARAVQSQRAWSAMIFRDRGDAVIAIADGLRARRDEAATLITAEMGKPLAEARSEIDKCIWVCEHYAERA